MSTSFQADRPARADEPARGCRGFTLVEVLVALVVAGFVLPSLARAFGGAWASTRMPMEIVSAMAVARNAADGGSVPADARGLGFTVDRMSGPVTVLVLPSDVAPAPRGTGKAAAAGEFHSDATPAAFKLALPDGLGRPSAGAVPSAATLRRLSVAVRTPSGRRVQLQAVTLDDAPR